MKLGKLAGTQVIIHPTFWLIFALVGLAGANAGLEFAAIAVEIGFVATLFVCVVLHELGHVLAARRYGIRTDSITLYPIGGVARLERMPERPRDELVVALAGPLVNAAIAALLFGALLFVDSAFVTRLALVNVLLVLFNLLPAFPMDGGRVLRALLAMRISHARSTTIAAGVGRALAVPFAVVGLLWNPLLLPIAVFVWFAATAEARAVRARESLGGARVMQASMTNVLALQPHARLAHAAELTLDSVQKDFPVLRNGEIIGALTQGELLKAIEKRGPETVVADVMRVSPPGVEAGDRLERAVELMQTTGAPFLTVSDDGRLIGIVTMDNVQEFVRLRQAFGGRDPIRVQRLPSGPEPALLN